jgi:hypothetical protein
MPDRAYNGEVPSKPIIIHREELSPPETPVPALTPASGSRPTGCMHVVSAFLESGSRCLGCWKEISCVHTCRTAALSTTIDNRLRPVRRNYAVVSAMRTEARRVCRWKSGLDNGSSPGQAGPRLSKDVTSRVIDESGTHAAARE